MRADEFKTDPTSPNDLGRRSHPSIPDLSVGTPKKPRRIITSDIESEGVPRGNPSFELQLVTNRNALSLLD